MELFEHTLQNKIENVGFVFSCARKTFGKCTEHLKNDGITLNHMISPTDFSPNTNPNNGDCCVFKIPPGVYVKPGVDVKHLMRFQTATIAFRFLRRSVKAARGNRVLPEKWGGKNVRRASQNPYPIYDQNL